MASSAMTVFVLLTSGSLNTALSSVICKTSEALSADLAIVPRSFSPPVKDLVDDAA